MSLSPAKIQQKSPSNRSGADDEYESPFFKLEYRTKNNFMINNPIFVNKSDLKNQNKYQIRQRLYSNKKPAQFSNSLIKSKVLATKDLYAEPFDLKFSARTQLNPEYYNFFMKTAKGTSKSKGTDMINFNRKQSRKSQLSKKPIINQFKLLIKESEKYLGDLSHRSMKVFDSARNKNAIKTQHNESNLGDNLSWSKMRKKTNPNITHRSFFDFPEEPEVKKPNETPIVWTFGKYKTIHQRSHSFTKKKPQSSRFFK